MRGWILAGVVGAGLVAFTVVAWPPRDELEPRVAQGNAAFAQREFPQALGHYEAAPGDGPRNAGVHANRGLAWFRTLLAPGDGGTLPELAGDAGAPEGYSGAQDELRSAARGASNVSMEDIDAQVRARAQYNLGNTFFAEHSWRNAMDAYKEALRLGTSTSRGAARTKRTTPTPAPTRARTPRKMLRRTLRRTRPTTAAATVVAVMAVARGTAADRRATAAEAPMAAAIPTAAGAASPTVDLRRSPRPMPQRLSRWRRSTSSSATPRTCSR